MIKMNRLVLQVLLLLSPFFVVCVSANAKVVTGEIKRIYPTSGTVYFRLKNDICISGNQYYYFQMNDSTNTGKYASHNWYSLLLASAHANKSVSVKVASCPEEGHVPVVYIYQDY